MIAVPNRQLGNNFGPRWFRLRGLSQCRRPVRRGLPRTAWWLFLASCLAACPIDAVAQVAPYSLQPGAMPYGQPPQSSLGQVPSYSQPPLSSNALSPQMPLGSSAYPASFESPSQIRQPLDGSVVPPPALPGLTGAPPEPPSRAPAAQPTDIVVDVRVTGNRRTPTESLMRHIKTRPGRPYSAELVGQDVRRLNESGLVIDVRPQYQAAPNGKGRIVVFEVFERATIGYVKYVGNRAIKKKTLAKEAKLKRGDALDTFAIEEARRRLEAFYKEKGFAKARVSLHEGDQTADQGVVFLINEGSKQTVLWTSFEGNTIVGESRLRTQIKSKQGVLWIFGGELNRKQIEADEDRLEEYYHALGFFRVRVGHVLEEHSFSAQRDWITIKFIIDEGPRYKIRNLSVVGNQKIDTPELVRLLEVESGQYFNQDQMHHDQNTIKDRYGAVGYIFADVQPEIRFYEEPGALDIVFHVEEGERYRVGKIDIDIAGDFPHTQITTVLNRLSLEPGDIIDIRELRESQRRLRLSQLFKVDPQSGAVPEIAFSPPTQEEIEQAKIQFARRQAAAGEFRGQDPAGVPGSDGGQPPVAPGDRWSNVTFGAGAVGPQTEYQPSVPAGRRSSSDGSIPNPGVAPQSASPIPQATPVLRGQAPGRAGLPWSSAHGKTRLEVVRGQYTPNRGSSTPVLPPAAGPAPTRWNAAPTPSATPSVTNDYSVTPPPGTVNPHAQAVPPPQIPPPSAVVTPRNRSFFQNFDFFGERDPGSFMGSLPSDDPAIPLPLNPRVRETETGRFMISAGVNSDAGLVGSLVIDEQNFDWRRFPRGWEDFRNGTAFRGRGQRFRLEAMPGSEVQRYVLTFGEPYLFDSRVGLGLNASYYTRFYTEWDEQRLGGRVSLQYELTHDLSASAAVRYSHVTLSDPIAGAPQQLLDAVGESDLIGFRGQLTHDTRDSTFLATEGYLMTLGFEQVVGTYQYPRADIDVRKYFMLHQRPDASGRHVLSMKGTASYTGSDTPIYEHYFAGGFSTMRGFDFRGASPRENGIPVGGEFSLLASTEYMFPLTASDSIRGVVFCDTGAVQPTISDWRDKYRVAPGFGFRVTIPAMGPAPIALDFAFPIVSEAGDEEEVFSFFIGFLR